MKRNIAIVLGLVIIIVGAYAYSKRGKTVEVKENVEVQEGSQSSMTMFEGDVVRNYKGEQKVAYSFAIPEGASTTLDMNKALVRVTNGATPFATVYFSFEGQRGYSAQKYLDDVIAPKVQVVTPVGDAMIGNTMWYKAQSDLTEWHMASVDGGKWLVIVESKKADAEVVQKMLSSFSVK